MRSSNLILLTFFLVMFCLAGCETTPEKQEEEAARETIAEIKKETASRGPAETAPEKEGKRTWKQHAKDDWGDLGGNLVEDIKGLWAREDLAHNVIVLGGAGALTGISIDHWDTKVRKRVREHDFLGDWDDVGDVLGHPGTHWGIMGLLYTHAKVADDPKSLETSKRLTEALILNDLTTLLLKGATGRNRPNGDHFSFPSGHVSSSFAMAAVLDGAYGPWVGMPMYMLGAFVGLSRIDANKHHLSDVIFGAALGYVFGRTVTKVHERKVLGFDVAPWVDPNAEAGGIMLQRRF